MINPISSYNLYNVNLPSFGYFKLAKHKYLKDSKKWVLFYQLNKSDIGYFEHQVKNLEKFFKKYDVDNQSARQVIEEAFNAGIQILKRPEQANDKTRIIMAFYDNEPSAILIGNALKVDENGHLHYSSRKEHGENETELDWLATWNKKIPGEGRSIVFEYFQTVIKDGFTACFVRSEVPEKSSAEKFYKRMGFRKFARRRSIFRKKDNKYVIGKFDDKADKIVPMLATAKSIVGTIKKYADIIKRVEYKTKRNYTLPFEEF